MENLEMKYPSLYDLLKTKIFKNKDFDSIWFTDEHIILEDMKTSTYEYCKIELIQGYIIGQNSDGSYTSLAMNDLYHWETTIRDFNRRNR